MFEDLAQNNDIVEAEERLGGFSVMPSDIYRLTIKLAYVVFSQTPDSKARGVAFTFVNKDGVEFNETFWVTNKAGQNYSIDDNDPKKTKKALRGYTTVNNICNLVAGKDLSGMDIQDKTFKIYDFSERKELNKSVPTLVDLIGKTIVGAVHHEIVNKQKKDDRTGKYEPIADTREQNVLDRVFDEDSLMTPSEIRKKATTPDIYTGWLERYKGKVRDRTDKNLKGNSSGAPAASGGNSSAPAASEAGGAASRLFGNRS